MTELSAITPNGSHVLAAGDVSLDYVLRFFERSAPGMARDASSYLQRMKGAVQ